MDSQPADLDLGTRWLNGRPVITVAGEIDMHSAPALHAYLLDTVAIASRHGANALVMDLSAVTFMDASGLSTLLRADRHTRHAGRRLRLAGPPAPITRLLTITHLDRHFDLHPTSHAATTAATTTRPDQPAADNTPPTRRARR